MSKQSEFGQTLRILKETRSLVEMQALGVLREAGVMTLSHAIAHQIDAWLADLKHDDRE